MPTAEEAADTQYSEFFNADELLAAPYAGLRQQATLRMSFAKPSVPTMLRQSPAGSLPLRAEVETSHGYAPYH